MKLSLEKNVFIKNGLLNRYFLDEIWKNSVDFWHRKLNLKVQCWHFLRPWHWVNLKNTAISFEYSWFLSKDFASIYLLVMSPSRAGSSQSLSWGSFSSTRRMTFFSSARNQELAENEPNFDSQLFWYFFIINLMTKLCS